MEALLQPLIVLIVVGVIASLLLWLLGQIPMPEPFKMVGKAIICIAIVVFLLKFLTPYV